MLGSGTPLAQHKHAVIMRDLNEVSFSKADCSDVPKSSAAPNRRLCQARRPGLRIAIKVGGQDSNELLRSAIDADGAAGGQTKRRDLLDLSSAWITSSVIYGWIAPIPVIRKSQ
jgi:hypothetical protein